MANLNVTNIGELLVQEGIISESDYKNARQENAESGKPLTQILIDSGFITEKQKTTLLRSRLGVDVADASNLELNEVVLQQIPAAFARQKRVIPIKIDNGVLHVGMEDPCDWETIENLKTMTGMNIRPCIASGALVDAAIKAYPEQTEEQELIVIKGPSLLLRILKPLSLMIFIILPMVVGVVVLINNRDLQKALLEQELTIFDIFIYLALGLSLWSVIIFYIHGLVFPEEMKKEDEE